MAARCTVAAGRQGGHSGPLPTTPPAGLVTILVMEVPEEMGRVQGSPALVEGALVLSYS